MCNSYRLKKGAAEIADVFSELKLPLRFEDGRVPNLEPRDSVRITETAPIIRSAEGGLELVERPWSWRGPSGAPVFNFRSEGRRFPPEARRAIPTDGFYEFTADEDPKARRKVRWLFTMPGEDLFFIAGHAAPQAAGAWTMLTVEPGPDIAPFHNRQVVVLRPEAAAAWLKGAPEAEILRPAPAGTLASMRLGG